ncbi:hypothetical protein DCAR_0205316 [Daucus carota subsp. sativus]|uniref:Uncharacterized protein n=1 Tax=Daucus carota subsp. sativus TaxID=79200 RepID=A0A175Y9N2_DAUCS|nr:hypothetical protein DCAR_0205316 [Daucus carota subsp. sativus]
MKLTLISTKLLLSSINLIEVKARSSITLQKLQSCSLGVQRSKSQLEKENLCLYGLPSEKWEVNLPVEEVPPDCQSQL